VSLLPKYSFSSCLVHTFCNTQAIKIFQNDNKSMLDSLNENLELINYGNSWCDEGFKNKHHFYHPKTGKGLLGLTGADIKLIDYYRKCLSAYCAKSRNNFFFYFGAVLHIIQDLCVPHHIFGKLLNGHLEYENWVIKHHQVFSIDSGAEYHFTDPLEIIKSNALKALDFEELIDKPDTKRKIEATRYLLGLAQKSSASFIYLCQDMLIDLSKPSNPINHNY